MVVAANHHVPLAQGALAGFAGKTQIVGEPRGLNTAPAIALATQIALTHNPKAVLVTLPSDHLIEPLERFRRHLEVAIECADKNAIVTLGVIPTHPATGYGYMEIEADPRNAIGEPVGVKRFLEKPTDSKARQLIEEGRVVWNAGIFVFPAQLMADKLAQHMPELWNAMSQLKPDHSNIDSIYQQIGSQSIDYGVMEKLTDLKCVPTDVTWSDLGCWEEVAANDSSRSDRLEVEAKGNYYSGTGVNPKKIVFLGVDDTIVVDTPDAMLVMKKGAGQKVKDVVTRLEANPKDQHLTQNHTFETRPWGSFRVLADTPSYKAKSIVVLPGQKLSYQSHNKRAEHWTVVSGIATVTLDDKEHTLRAGEHIFIPLKAKHRIANPGNTPMEFVEVQTGSYFGEDDIVRYSDDYGRR